MRKVKKNLTQFGNFQNNFHILNFKLVNYFRNSEKFPGAVLPCSLVFSCLTMTVTSVAQDWLDGCQEMILGRPLGSHYASLISSVHVRFKENGEFCS